MNTSSHTHEWAMTHIFVNDPPLHATWLVHTHDTFSHFWCVFRVAKAHRMPYLAHFFPRSSQNPWGQFVEWDLQRYLILWAFTTLYAILRRETLFSVFYFYYLGLSFEIIHEPLRLEEGTLERMTHFRLRLTLSLTEGRRWDKRHRQSETSAIGRGALRIVDYVDSSMWYVPL